MGAVVVVVVSNDVASDVSITGLLVDPRGFWAMAVAVWICEPGLCRWDGINGINGMEFSIDPV